MTNKIEKTAVLGAGVMGAQLAGHFANAGIPTLLFDINMKLANQGIETLKRIKPAPLFNPKNTSLITPCSYEKHLELLSDVDWVLEAVAEKLDIKHKVYEFISPHLKSDGVLSSNTSGIPLNDLTKGLPDTLHSRFMITHFFNPPRYMRLLELVRGEKTDDDTYNLISEFGETKLGKGIVHAKDTPNFIANRIGVYGMMLSIKQAMKMNFSVESVDKLTGTIVGRQKSATFRTADIVGLDTLAHVAQTSYDRGENDEERDIFIIPQILKTLIESDRIGAKSKAGFYKKENGVILALDLNSGEYKKQVKEKFDGFRLAKDHQNTLNKIKALAYSDDKAGKYFWEILSKTLIYAANRIPEISDDIVNVDNAMKWGFAWSSGPFETWDGIGLSRSVDRMINEGKKPPKWVLDLAKTSDASFFKTENENTSYFDFSSTNFKLKSASEKSINLNLKKSSGNLVKRHWSASLIDIGDGILNLEFHSVLQPTLNPIDGSMLEMINEGLDLLEAEKYKAMVMGHHGEHFCAGANIAAILQFCENKDWKGLEKTVKIFQDLTQKIRFSKAPVVAAPFHLALGGGFEFIAPTAKRISSAELYIGAVEVGLGLIPGAGGNLRLVLNLMGNAGKTGRLNVFPLVQKAFETIGFAKVATSAEEAKYLGYLLKSDTVVMNLDHLLWTAKQTALELSDNYSPPEYRDDLKLPGMGGRTAMKTALKGFKMQGKISDHDELVGQKLAYVITGGDKAGLTKKVDEQYLLDIEREAFVSLAGEKLSQDRIRYMLKKGKPLRN
ncbi:MAG: 3-hydroxyacyl-CoA dehydrogenase [Candidatus Marinimicrobia bacterium]|nr:3-hydroxyacyl-CoA dehydrogenase [Candidatus Neomarinimicrobiota bacterium]|tara:strand:+ start:3876 stop:6224 length:2349 start_codon:yes stop_codon:yes gene_type:complete